MPRIDAVVSGIGKKPNSVEDAAAFLAQDGQTLTQAEISRLQP